MDFIGIFGRMEISEEGIRRRMNRDEGDSVRQANLSGNSNNSTKYSLDNQNSKNWIAKSAKSLPLRSRESSRLSQSYFVEGSLCDRTLPWSLTSPPASQMAHPRSTILENRVFQPSPSSTPWLVSESPLTQPPNHSWNHTGADNRTEATALTWWRYERHCVKIYDGMSRDSNQRPLRRRSLLLSTRPSIHFRV